MIYKLCKSKNEYKNQLVNINPDYNRELLTLNEYRYCHFHFKRGIYVKNKWDLENLKELIKILNENKYKILLTSDIEKSEFNNYFND